MGTLVHDCPHCRATKVAFSIESEFELPERHTLAIAGLCNACGQPMCAVLNRTSDGVRMGMLPSHVGIDILKATEFFTLRAFYPEAKTEEVPANVPAQVAKAFTQASGCRSAGHLDAAAGMYRKAMELALKAFSPDIEAWKLEKRIDKMAAEHRITPELQAWAHELRLDGNDAMHGDEETTADMANQMHELCRFLLIYLYALPAQVANAKSRRGGS